MEFAFIDNYTEKVQNHETKLIFIHLKFISQVSSHYKILHVADK